MHSPVGRVFKGLPTLAGVVAGTLVFSGTLAFAAPTPETSCRNSLHKEAGKYASCIHKTLAKSRSAGDLPAGGILKCVAKYGAAWPKLQVRYPGTSCDGPRFVDNGGGTVSDNLTGLEWELKSFDASIHNVNDTYAWSSVSPEGDGPAYTTFIANLNDTCFAGSCDWRLPTFAELPAIYIAVGPTQCSSSPCIEPPLEPIGAGFYWTATTDDGDISRARGVAASSHFSATPKTALMWVRAVRGGL